MSRIRDIAGPAGVDFAVEATGRADTIEQAFHSVRKGDGLCVFASHPPTGEKICLDPHDLISGKQIRGTWGGGSRPDHDIPLYADLCVSGRLPLGRLISHEYSLDDINQALAELNRANVSRALVKMQHNPEERREVAP
jgi:S-(hydroxymethyl)glutathione dehydrogenase/alcohol dehydrogenase